jgi:hypothetical protein
MNWRTPRHLEGTLWFLSFFSLILAAQDSLKPLLPILGGVPLLSITIVIPLHFYRAWRRWSTVPNRRQYAAWVGFETLATIGLVALLVYSLFSK